MAKNASYLTFILLTQTASKSFEGEYGKTLAIFLKILAPQSADMVMRSIFCSAGSAVVAIRVADHSELADMTVEILAGLWVEGITAEDMVAVGVVLAIFLQIILYFRV